MTRCEYPAGEPAARKPEEVADAFWLAYGEFETRADVPEYVEAFAVLVEAQRTG